ncbi:MAG: hypothetical protein ACI39R_04535 [Lachnospiraceae bacterium]
MAFCTKCGKEIKDGEICSCELTGAGSKSSVDVKGLANGIVGTAADIVVNPKEGTKSFVEGISWLYMSILAGVYALIRVLFNIIDKIKANSEHKKLIEEWADDWDMDVEDYIDEFDVEEKIYSFGDFIKGAFMDILYVAAAIAITAVVIYFAVMLIKKVKITWRTAFAIAVIDLLVIIPLVLLNDILGLIPSFKLLSWIMAAISSVRAWGAMIITYLGIKSVCGDTKSTVYVSAPSYFVISFATSLVNFIIASIF